MGDTRGRGKGSEPSPELDGRALGGGPGDTPGAPEEEEGPGHLQIKPQGSQLSLPTGEGSDAAKHLPAPSAHKVTGTTLCHHHRARQLGEQAGGRQARAGCEGWQGRPPGVPRPWEPDPGAAPRWLAQGKHHCPVRFESRPSLGMGTKLVHGPFGEPHTRHIEQTKALRFIHSFPSLNRARVWTAIRVPTQHLGSFPAR